jgi:hypothetical protein
MKSHPTPLARHLGLPVADLDPRQVCDEDHVHALFEYAGPLDHVTATAADIDAYQPIGELLSAGARKTIESKLLAALLLAKRVSTALPDDGSITFTRGMATDRPVPGDSVVAAVNSSLSGLRFGPCGVRTDTFIRGYSKRKCRRRLDSYGQSVLRY